MDETIEGRIRATPVSDKVRGALLKCARVYPGSAAVLLDEIDGLSCELDRLRERTASGAEDKPAEVQS